MLKREELIKIIEEYRLSHIQSEAEVRSKLIVSLIEWLGYPSQYRAEEFNVYGAAGSMSGGVDFRPFPLNWNIQDELGEMAANKKIWDEHVVVNQIDKIENGDLALIVDCGEQDFFLEVNKSLHLRLLGKGIDHDFTTRPGGHDSTYWANSLDYQLLFFIKYFNEQN